MRHEIPVAILDPLLFAEVDGRKYVLTSHLDADQVRKALPDAEVLDYVDLGFRKFTAEGMSFAEAGREAEARAVRELGIDEAIVPAGFPVGLADRLRADGVVVTVDDPAVEVRRRTKTPAELAGIRIALKAAEAAMAAACDLLGRAGSGEDGKLELDGKPLRAEDVRDRLRAVAAENGAPAPPDVIVASVWDGIGHDPGSGPLPAGLPIQIDVWPHHEESGCWADMARTFVVGEPIAEHAERIAKQAELVHSALLHAQESVRPGITGRELFDAVCNSFEAAGYATQRTTETADDFDGFQHSLGHGVGLEVHEPPQLGLAGHEPLVIGDVLAIEPGLWDKRFGGVIFEDLVLVTETGGEVLTQFPYDLALPR